MLTKIIVFLFIVFILFAATWEPKEGLRPRKPKMKPKPISKPKAEEDGGPYRQPAKSPASSNKDNSNYVELEGEVTILKFTYLKKWENESWGTLWKTTNFKWVWAFPCADTKNKTKITWLNTSYHSLREAHRALLHEEKDCFKLKLLNLMKKDIVPKTVIKL